MTNETVSIAVNSDFVVEAAQGRFLHFDCKQLIIFPLDLVSGMGHLLLPKEGFLVELMSELPLPNSRQYTFGGLLLLPSHVFDGVHFSSQAHELEYDFGPSLILQNGCQLCNTKENAPTFQ